MIQQSSHQNWLNPTSSVHTSKTMMYTDLDHLLSTCPKDSTVVDYRHAIVNTNILAKRSMSSRKESFTRLKSLYILDPDHLIFRAFRDLWEGEDTARPMLALLCANARDHTLRATNRLILNSTLSSEIRPSMLADQVRDEFPNRYTHNTLASLGRNLASTWTQSGHIQGRSGKIRVRATSSPRSTSFALFLAFLDGDRGAMLGESTWAQILDLSLDELWSQAMTASRLGWLEYRSAGDIKDVTFHYLLRDLE